MNKAGYIISLIGGVLALFLSVMLIAAGPVLTIGPDALEFYTENEDDLYDMWTLMGQYNNAAPFLETEFENYVDEQTEIISDLDARELGKMAERYDNDAFAELAGIFEDNEDYLPALKLGVIACLAASILALVGAELARRFRIAGGAMVLTGAALTLVFSLVGGAIIPMAAASLLLILGGILQILRPSEKAMQKAAKKKKKLPMIRKAAFGIGFIGSILGLVFALLMIFTVPAKLVSETVEDLKDDMDREHVIAFNETALALADEDISIYSEEAVTAFATDEVARGSQLITDADVYEDAIEFVYDAGTHAAFSMGVVGIAIILALIAFIGALVCKRAPIGGGVMMLFCALCMLLAAIYTNTVMPMLIAFGLMTLAGILALWPTKVPLPAGAQYAQTATPTVPLQPVMTQRDDMPQEDVPFSDEAPDEDDE